MPEINGITQVDIPGIISAYDEQKRQGLQDLYLRQKMDRETRQAQTESAIQDAYRGLVRTKKIPPSQGSAVSSNLMKLSQVGSSGGVAAAAGVPTTRSIGALYLGAPAGPEAGLSAPAVVAPANPVGRVDPVPITDLPHPPAHLLPDVEQTDDGVDFSPGLSLDRAKLDELAALNPKAAYDLVQMDDEARARAFKRISDDVDFTGRLIGAVRKAPENQRQAVYQQIRADMAARGFTAMPERWDEEKAETLQRMGLTALQAFQDDRADRKAAQDAADDQADNERADRNTNSVIADRDARRGLTVRGQNMTDARGRRGQDMDSADRRRGQDITDKRVRETGTKGHSAAQPIVDVQTPEQARQLKPGTIFRTPDGRVKVR